MKSLLWDKEKTSLEKAAEQAVAESEAMRSRCVYLEVRLCGLKFFCL